MPSCLIGYSPAYYAGLEEQRLKWRQHYRAKFPHLTEWKLREIVERRMRER